MRGGLRFAAVPGVLLLTGCAALQPSRPAVAGLPALYQVDEGFFRGGQPSAEGMRHLARMGIKTIVSLRHHSQAMDDEQRLARQLGMQWVNIPMSIWWWPTTEQASRFLAVVTEDAQRPVFVHCRQGWNRVGIMTAVYRMTYHGWGARRAYAEGRRLGLVPWNVMTRYMIARLAKQCAGRFSSRPREEPAATRPGNRIAHG